MLWREKCCGHVLFECLGLQATQIRQHMAKAGDGCLQLVLQVDEIQIIFRGPLCISKGMTASIRAVLYKAGKFQAGFGY